MAKSFLSKVKNTFSSKKDDAHSDPQSNAKMALAANYRDALSKDVKSYNNLVPNETRQLSDCADAFCTAANDHFAHTRALTRHDLHRLRDVYTSVPGLSENATCQAVAKQCFSIYFSQKTAKRALTQQDYNEATNFISATGIKVEAATNTAGTMEANIDQAQPIVEVFLNVDTDRVENEPVNYDSMNKEDKKTYAVSRGSLNEKREVGHTWLTIRAAGPLPEDVNQQIKGTRTGMLLNSLGETAIGFWPQKFTNLFYLNDNNELAMNPISKARTDLGYSYGGGGSTNANANGYRKIHNVPGKTEEPDDAHKPRARQRFALNKDQFLKLHNYAQGKKDHFYNLETYNCTTFATHALQHAGFDVSGTYANICYPAAMYRELYAKAKADVDKGKKSDVQLRKLAEHESHNKFNDQKRGDAANERMQNVTVDNFDNQMISDYLTYPELTKACQKLDAEHSTENAANLLKVLIDTEPSLGDLQYLVERNNTGDKVSTIVLNAYQAASSGKWDATSETDFLQLNNAGIIAEIYTDKACAFCASYLRYYMKNHDVKLPDKNLHYGTVKFLLLAGQRANWDHRQMLKAGFYNMALEKVKDEKTGKMRRMNAEEKWNNSNFNLSRDMMMLINMLP